MLGNLPTEQTRSHWAVFLIILVVVLFGLFWVKQSREIEDQNSNALPLATQPQQKSVQLTQQKEPDLLLLEASAVNISVPSFEEIF